MSDLCNDSASILAQALEEMKTEQGSSFSLETVNLAELERRTGISRKRLRRLKSNGFVVTPHGRTGLKAGQTVLSGYTGIIDNLLRSNTSNSSVIYERLTENGYSGGLTQIKVYIRDHKYLLPPKRMVVSPQGNRGRRYTSAPGEAFQMDWGFVDIVSYDGTTFRAACFAMICHHCGKRYIEFFPNAKQENLFIGMIHAFAYMGIPVKVLTDNMKSVVIRRDSGGHPIWNKDYELFMKSLHFETVLCKPKHPFTKGCVERLMRFVKDNFAAGRVFYNITDLNESALEWCEKQNNTYHRAVDCIPSEIHSDACLPVVKHLDKTTDVVKYLCPIRTISFDGFVTYEGRRFGVPYHYSERTCRVGRSKSKLYIYNLDLTVLLVTHDVTWARKDSFCENQFASGQPEEQPTMPVTTVMRQLEQPKHESGFSKFNFDREEDPTDG